MYLIFSYFRFPYEFLLRLFLFSGSSNGAQYLGKYLGKLSEYHHGVSGEVYAVDGRTLHIKDFSYDGQAPGMRQQYIYNYM